tara:strand:- start:131 stop:682 length:552 start_codon:yes stop_codon:yes gene_type:complete
MANTIKLYDVLDNTKNIYLSNNALENLLDFERVLDILDLYVFENWINGELIMGPTHSRYFVECEFMWPYKSMPNPLGGKRLLDYGITVTYRKSKLTKPVKDLESYPKKVNIESDSVSEIETKEMRIWIVTIKIPRKLMGRVERGYIELQGEKLNLEDIEKAEYENLDQAAAAPEMAMEPMEAI